MKACDVFEFYTRQIGGGGAIEYSAIQSTRLDVCRPISGVSQSPTAPWIQVSIMGMSSSCRATPRKFMPFGMTVK